MKRRSFLAMLGLAPVAGPILAQAASAPVLQNGGIITDLIGENRRSDEYTLMTRSWNAPGYRPKMDRIDKMVMVTEGPDFVAGPDNPNGTPVLVGYIKGRAVTKIWWLR